MQNAAAIEPGKRPAAGSDCVDVEHGNGNWDVGNPGVVRDLRTRRVDERNISRGSAHVKTHNVLKAGDLCDTVRSDYTSGGAGQHGANRFFRSDLSGHNSAGR